jgi:hypothetical protein
LAKEPLGPLVTAALAQDPAARPGAKAVLLGLLGDGEEDLLARAAR